MSIEHQIAHLKTRLNMWRQTYAAIDEEMAEAEAEIQYRRDEVTRLENEQAQRQHELNYTLTQRNRISVRIDRLRAKLAAQEAKSRVLGLLPTVKIEVEGSNVEGTRMRVDVRGDCTAEQAMVIHQQIRDYVQDLVSRPWMVGEPPTPVTFPKRSESWGSAQEPESAEDVVTAEERREKSSPIDPRCLIPGIRGGGAAHEKTGFFAYDARTMTWFRGEGPGSEAETWVEVPGPRDETPEPAIRHLGEWPKSLLAGGE